MADSEFSPVYLLIGGAGGQGTALTRRLINRGATVVAASRDEGRLSAYASETGAQTHVCDARDFDAVEQLVSNVVDSHGRLDGAVNLAGSILIKPVHMVSRAEFDDTIAENLTTAFALTRAVARPMAKSGGGSLVLMSSCAARTGLVSHEAIAAAKGAVIGLVQSAAASLAPGGVRVNCVAPGLVDTPMASRLTASDTARKASESLHPLGRLGTPDDLAPVLDWLLGPESSWVTGQTIGVDGGLAAIKGKG
jgi:NAD(P)-dependent dehydrogenase (short-subunit alcohol dehydrogenase family)